jgi:hypothetical protein
MRKKILIGFLLTVGILTIILAIVGGFILYRHYFTPLRMKLSVMPEKFKKTGVLIGKDFLSKSLYFQDTALGTISDIAWGEFDPSPGQELAIVGTQGALFLDDKAQVKSSVKFNVRAGHVIVVDVESDGISEYLDRGGGWQDVSLIDHKGNAIWTYDGHSRGLPGIDNIIAGDMDHDGILEFVVGFNGRGGVRLLDRNAKEQWTQPDGNVWHLEMVDVNADKNLEIVHSNAEGEITIRDKDGKIIHKAKPCCPYVASFSLCRWPNKKAQQSLLFARNNDLFLFDFFGKFAAKFDAPLSSAYNYSSHTRGVFDAPLSGVYEYDGDARGVSIQTDHAEYFAVVVNFSLLDRSVFYIYGPDQKLVYQEILPEECASITSLSLDSNGRETLLLGGQGKVWKYTLLNDKGASENKD